MVADGRHPIKGRFIESVGWYDPKQRGVNYALKLDRVDFWSDRGAQMSDTVKSLVKKCRNAPPSALGAPAAGAASAKPTEAEPVPAETSEEATDTGTEDAEEKSEPASAPEA